ncbi:unnamed protein product, partial [Cercopithifilaria johnstoni]
SILLLSLGWESSNFIVSKRKSNMLLLKETNMDISKTWIHCIDGNLPSQYGVNLKNEDKNKTISLTDANSLVDDITSGSKCMCSTIKNSQDSITMDKFDCEMLWYGKRNCSIRSDDVSKILNSKSRLFNHSNINAMETTREEIQDCLMIRSKFRLPPFSLNRMLAFNNFPETPINYTAISDNKFLCCYDLWNLTGTECTEPSKKSYSETAEAQPFSLPGQSISLPCTPDLFLKDIFVGDEFIEHNCDSSFVKREHRINNCFYCSWPEEYFGSRSISEIEVSTEARDQIISMFLLQGSKCSVNSKKLLNSVFVNLILSERNGTSFYPQADFFALLSGNNV